MVFEIQDDEILVNFESPEEQQATIENLKKLPDDDRDAAFRDVIVGDVQVKLDDGEDWTDLGEDEARTLQVCLERYGENEDAMRLLDVMGQAGF